LAAAPVRARSTDSPGQLEDLVHQRRQPLRLGGHPPGEPAHRLRVVRGVLHRLGEQRQRPHRGLELVGHVHHEVAADRLQPAGLRAVLRQHQQLPGADLRHPHLQHHRAGAERPARQLQLLVPDHPGAPHVGDQVAHRGVHHGAVPHHAQRVGRRRRPHHPLLVVQHHGGRAQHGEHPHQPLVQLGLGLRRHGALLALAPPERQRRADPGQQTEGAREEHDET
jgi:hypothetical protein